MLNLDCHVTVHMPGCCLMKIGNLGTPALVNPWNLNVTLDPILHGLLLCLSVKPDPILKVVPLSIFISRAPSMPEHLPVPF